MRHDGVHSLVGVHSHLSIKPACVRTSHSERQEHYRDDDTLQRLSNALRETKENANQAVIVLLADNRQQYVVS